MIYGISDLHLDYTKQKTMEVFGSGWKDYEQRIMKHWRETIKADDLVLVPGDISWALTLEESMHDFRRLEELPGIKLFMKGNHDYWWQSLSKIRRQKLQNMFFLQNDSFVYRDVHIYGTRGWASTDSAEFMSTDLKVFKRELIRLELSLQSLKFSEYNIVMLHYPPFRRDRSLNEFGEIISKYPIDCCVYGHLHSNGHENIVEGTIANTDYHCISTDYLEFIPKLLYRGNDE